MRNGRLFACGNTFSLVNKFYKTFSRGLSVCLTVRISVGRPLRTNQLKRKCIKK